MEHGGGGEGSRVPVPKRCGAAGRVPAAHGCSHTRTQREDLQVGTAGSGATRGSSHGAAAPELAGSRRDPGLALAPFFGVDVHKTWLTGTAAGSTCGLKCLEPVGGDGLATFSSVAGAGRASSGSGPAPAGPAPRLLNGIWPLPSLSFCHLAAPCPLLAACCPLAGSVPPSQSRPSRLAVICALVSPQLLRRTPWLQLHAQECRM